MQQLASNFKATNPGSSVHVSGYHPRPLMTTSTGSAAKPKSYKFIQAVTTLPAIWSDQNLARIFQVVGQHFQGELRSLFVALSDDDRIHCQELAKAQQRGCGRRSAPGSGFGPSASVSTSSAVAGPGDSMDLQTGGRTSILESLRHPPLPPLPAPIGKHPRQAPELESDSENRRGLKLRRLSLSSASPSSDRGKKKKS